MPMTIPMPCPPSPIPADLSSVALGRGPPTRGELVKFYPHKFSWKQLKSFIESGDLGLLKRDPLLQVRYSEWAKGIKRDHGSITNYLVTVRLGWGSHLSTGTPPTATTSPSASVSSLPLSHEPSQLILTRPLRSEYFTSNPSPDDVKIIFNDWPYSVPPDIYHYLIWSRLPVVHPALVHTSVRSQVDRDGLWGFGGVLEGDISGEDLYADVASGTSSTARAHILAASHHTHQFVIAHWPEDEWEVAWFVNPPRLQSVKDLSHIHVFARRK